jgi:hypothetical protein
MRSERKPQWYEDIPKLMADTDELYGRIASKWPEETKRNQTAKKMVALRGWEPSMRLIARNFHVLDELQVAYVPKVMQPGPCFMFPLRDADGEYRYAQLKPLPGSAIKTTGKYHFVGGEPLGPRLMGFVPSAIRQMLTSRTAVVVEGAFDCIACKLLSPEVPVLSPLTKKLSVRMHVPVLRMLGVRTLYLMYDNEASGQGNKAMEIEARSLSMYFDVQPLLCPASDPSEALKSATVARKLKRMLQNVLIPEVQSGVLEFE